MDRMKSALLHRLMQQPAGLVLVCGIAVLSIMLSGCKKTPDADVTAAKPANAQVESASASVSATSQDAVPASVSGGFLKDQKAALDKAKALEGQIQQQADERKKTIDDATK
jgi:uncharacterized lipoprotein YajG